MYSESSLLLEHGTEGQKEGLGDGGPERIGELSMFVFGGLDTMESY